MTKIINPFITSGYAGPEYFCDREAESADLISQLVNGNNVTLISPRRMGKSSLIEHCFQSKELNDYHKFFIDIYATNSLRELVYAMSKAILNTLKSRGQKAVSAFFKYVSSIKAAMSLDPMGNMTVSLQLGDIQKEETTLGQIFEYLGSADKPCIVALDEFQQIAYYPEKNVEAILRTHVQRCTNARFIFSESQMHTMAMMFSSSARPFYQSTSQIHLESIDLQKYTDFATSHFKKKNKDLQPEVTQQIYERFDGVTWYMQKMLNFLFFMTKPGGTCEPDMIPTAIEYIINSMQYSFQETMFRLPEKQKELLIAIARAGKAQNITSSNFIQTYSLQSASSVQSAAKGLLDKDFITIEFGSYTLCDKFLSLWLSDRF